MRVYRIETENGRGICATTGSKLCSLYNMVAGDETEHCYFCNRYDEQKACMLASNRNMAYAFPSMEALYNWFPTSKGRKVMEAYGARGVIYDVPFLEVFSKYQCIFDKTKATKIGFFAL